jgi:hypothetical protein
MVRPYFALMALGVFILLSAGSANAADLGAVRAYVPFSFEAGKTTLPPGQYVFRFDGVEMPGVLRVRGQDGREGAFVLAQKAHVPEGSGDEAKLVFEKEGSQYVLARVFDPGFGGGVQVLKASPRGEPERSATSTN